MDLTQLARSGRVRLAGMMALGLLGAAPLAAETLRLGGAVDGPASWETDTIIHHGLDRDAGMELRIEPLASLEARRSALLSGKVDLISADWIWAARQRSAGHKLSYIPGSTAIGGMVVPQGSLVRSLADLPGKRIGIGGGALDHTWALLQVMARKSAGVELATAMTPVFDTPAQINVQLDAGTLDAVVNDWHDIARLEAKGHHQFWSGVQMLHTLGIGESIPIAGYVFDQDWAGQHRLILAAWVEVTQRAKTLICTGDAEWKRLAPRVRATSGRESSTLRKRYCEGNPKRWGGAERQATMRVYELLREQGGDELVGSAEHLDAQILWAHVNY